MKMSVLLAAGAALLTTAAAPAPTLVPVPEFRSIELNGGGRVILRHGPRQRVTLLSGDTAMSRIEVGGGRRGGSSNPDQLVIDACRRSCSNYRLEVEVVTPSIEGVAVNGGGRIVTAGAFPRQKAIGAAVHGGGQIDIRSLPARQVGAAISGGGNILTTAEETLGAAINGGGAILYWGNPQVGTAVQGGGTVRRGS